MLFEQSGDGFTFLHDAIRESDFTGGRQMRTVLTGDTDLDGRQEVIVATGGSSPTSGLVAIWEHSGVQGENIYTRVFAYETVSYLFQAALGDADNDGWPEILLDLGGFGGFPLQIRRLEYEPGAGTWVHRQFASSVIGLPTTPHVADADGDGDLELLYGSEDEGGGFVVIFQATGENSFEPVWISPDRLSGNVMALDSSPVSYTHLTLPTSS
ncbi:MAG: VCBS repeat-containing protein, partial [Candidatus Eisenbacteria bacterium]|nr:VCBS repeat-containing protein [Candidatus Eisenbacteria bacterium]